MAEGEVAERKSFRQILEMNDRLHELREIRAQISNELTHRRIIECNNAIINGVQSVFAGLHRRVAEAFNKREANVQVREQYQARLLDIASRYDAGIERVQGTIDALHEQKEQLMLEQASMNGFMDSARNLVLRVAGAITPGLRAAVQELKVENEKKKAEIRAQIEKINDQIKHYEEQKEHIREEKEKRISEAQQTRDASLQKQSIFQRIAGRFGVGAQARADAIAKSIVERNERAAEIRAQHEHDLDDTEQSMAEQRAEIREAVQQHIEDAKESLTRFGNKVKEAPAQVREAVEKATERALSFTKNSLALIGLSTVQGMRKLIQKMIKGLQDFSDPTKIEQDKEAIQARKDALKGKEDKRDDAGDPEP